MASGGPFELQGVVHLVHPAGAIARNLDELKVGLSVAEPSSLFYHVVQAPLRAPASEDPAPDDLSVWIAGVLQDSQMAERVSFAAQRSAPTGAAALREALLDALSTDRTSGRSAPPDAPFVFLSSQSVTVPAATVASPDQLFDALTVADASVWFYHLAEQPWFESGDLPIVKWLRARGAPKRATWIEEASTSGACLDAIRRQVVSRWRRSRIGRRVALAARTPQPNRAEAGREAMARLARRIVGSDEDES